MEWISTTGRKILLLEGDITRLPVDGMVNAANCAGDPEIMRELDAMRKHIASRSLGQAA